MCAIFGFVARQKSTVSIDRLAAIVRGNIARGPHAFGFAWIDSARRLHCFKQCGRFTDSLGVLAMARDARMFIGHLRHATHGDPQNNVNNHPHPADAGWIVHNGIIGNHRAMIRETGLLPVSDCDSEALALTIERAEGGSLLRRCGEAVNAADGSLAMLGLWSRPATLVVARRGNPLHVSDTPDGVYLATLSSGLPKSHSVADNSIYAFTRDSGAIKMRRAKLASAHTVGALFDADGTYAGG